MKRRDFEVGKGWRIVAVLAVPGACYLKAGKHQLHVLQMPVQLRALRGYRGVSFPTSRSLVGRMCDRKESLTGVEVTHRILCVCAIYLAGGRFERLRGKGTYNVC